MTPSFERQSPTSAARPERGVWRSVALTAVAATSMACGTGQPRAIEAVYNPANGRLTELRYDADGDGRRETISYMDGRRVVRIEIDTDRDGRPDRWEHYDAAERLERIGFSRARDGTPDAWSSPGPDRAVTRIELSNGRDGRVDRVERYNAGVLASAEEDTDRDGRIDKWETYEGGRLASVAFDTSRGGSPDRRLVYGADGQARAEVLPSTRPTSTVLPQR